MVHLGMTGVLLAAAPEDAVRPHLHARLRLTAARRGAGALEIRYHDPRRFGWLALHRSEDEAVRRCWSRLGPDALGIDAGVLAKRLATRRTGLKSALLNQSIVAGLGNIYVDEALFRAGLNPRQAAGSLRRPQLLALAEACRTILVAALDAGGSTIRTYVDACGLTGNFALRHQVYGRGAEPCRSCGARLRQSVIAGRTTVHCPVCQRRFRWQRRPEM